MIGIAAKTIIGINKVARKISPSHGIYERNMTIRIGKKYINAIRTL